MADEREERREPRGATAGSEREATEVEREGMDLLGRSGVRDGALEGVSDSSARSDQSADPVATRAGTRGRGSCQDGEVEEHAGSEDGGLSASGGAAGGARGDSGRSTTGGDPESGARPSQADGTSRADLDHPSRRE